MTYFIQTEKKSQDLKEKPAIEENAFEALERDFQEVCIKDEPYLGCLWLELLKYFLHMQRQG